MSGAATITLRKYLLLRAWNLPVDPWTVVSVALTRQVPALNAGENQLDEPVGNGYGRIAVPWNSATWGLANDTEVANKIALNFGAASGYWGSITGWAIIAYGLPAAVGTLDTPLKVTSGIAPYVPIGGCSFGVFD